MNPRFLHRYGHLLMALALVAFAAAAPAQDRTEYDPVSGLSRSDSNQNVKSGTVDVTTCLFVRTGPGMQYPSLDCMPPGTPLQITGIFGDWYQINWNGQTAYCCAYWVHTSGQDWHNPDLAGGSSPDSTGGTPGPDPGGSNPEPAIGGSLLNMPLINQYTGGGSNPDGYCGPTSDRMVLAFYGIHTTADEVALGHLGPGTPMYIYNQGSTSQGVCSALQHFGLNANLHWNKSLAELRRETSQGHAVVVSVAGNYGPFYTAGHYFVVIGFTPSGGVIINDPAGGVRRVLDPNRFYSCWSGLNIEAWK